MLLRHSIGSRSPCWSRTVTFVLVYVFRKSLHCSCQLTRGCRCFSFMPLYPCWVQRARLHWSPFLQHNKPIKSRKISEEQLIDADTGQTIRTIKRTTKSKESTTTLKQVKASAKKTKVNLDWQLEENVDELQASSQETQQSVQVEDENESEGAESTPAPKKTSKKKTKKKEPEPIVPEYAIEDFFEHNDSIHEDMRYGTCKLCSAPIVIPGLDHYLCKECGWVSNSNQPNDI
ncbi:hypothetical protein GpartN1_g5076.t1 [Galdieria partita]|uniref:Uncharacterized protein n=1 Tax=Galdieria partita TaxID=83374 RepID=A0A9C7US63_9RHOD|nr:hypothetical protein GpartN1_g5076.t1 [Galdieria partita]